MIIVLLPFLVCVLGLLVFAFAANPKVQELGKLAYFAGLLVSLLLYAPSAIKLL